MPNSKSFSGPNILFADLEIQLADEHAGHLVVARSPGMKKLRDAQAELLKTVQAIGQTGDIVAILAAEKAILKNERRLYGNSANMRGSLDTALNEIAVAERHLPIVADPTRYKEVDASHALPRARAGGLPKDGARQALRSHDTRLLNMDKSRLSEPEKKIVKARRDNLYKAQEIYASMQRQALGIPSPDKARDKGLSR